MGYRAGIIERAYEIARSGKASCTPEIEVLLGREGYADAHAQLSGRVVRRDLRGFCLAARRARHDIDERAASLGLEIVNQS